MWFNWCLRYPKFGLEWWMAGPLLSRESETALPVNEKDGQQVYYNDQVYV